MAKPHYRLCPMVHMPYGTRFYTPKTFKPYTLIVKSVKKYKIWVHLGHEFDLNAYKQMWSGNTMGWVKV